MGGSSPPSPPKIGGPASTARLNDIYNSGAQNYLNFLPNFLNAEQGARDTYDPSRIAEQQWLQQTFGPTQYAQQTQALQQLDPEWYRNQLQLGNQISSNFGPGAAAQNILGSNIFGDLSKGYGLNPGQQYGQNAMQTAYANLLKGYSLNPGQQYGQDALAGALSDYQKGYGLNPGQQYGQDLMKQTGADLSLGYKLAPGQEQQIEQQIRGSQAARGNSLGSAAATAEGFALGDRGQQMYQQRLANAQAADQAFGNVPTQNYEQRFGNLTGAAQAFGNIPTQNYEQRLSDASNTASQFGNTATQDYQQRLTNAANFQSMTPSYLQNAMQFQQGSTPSQQMSLISPISADRSMAYVNPNAGFQGQQTALQNYQNQLAAYGIQNQQQQSPWGSILGGGLSILGSIAPILLGFSDKRLKSDIKPTGETLGGHKLYSYKIKPPEHREIGVIAQEVEKKQPDAVITDPETGFKKVDYGRLAGVY